MNNNLQKIPNGLGKSIRDLREIFGFSQSDLARRAGISRDVISSLEQEKRIPHIINLFKICDVFEITPSELCAQSFTDWKITKNSRERAELHKSMRKTMCKTITDVAVINKKE